MGSTLGGQWTGLVSASILVSEGPGESRMELQEPTKHQLAPSLGLSRVSGSAPLHLSIPLHLHLPVK